MNPDAALCGLIQKHQIQFVWVCLGIYPLNNFTLTRTALFSSLLSLTITPIACKNFACLLILLDFLSDFVDVRIDPRALQLLDHCSWIKLRMTCEEQQSGATRRLERTL